MATPEVPEGGRLQMRLRIKRSPLVLGQQLLGQPLKRPGRGGRLLLEPRQSVKPLHERFSLPHPSDLRWADRHPDHPELLADAEGRIGRKT